jgi:DNA polymerase-3 subunit delta'
MNPTFDELLIHHQTRQAIASYLKNPAQGLLLIGPAGSGKSTLAKAAAAQMLKTQPTALTNHPYFLTVLPETGKSEISIAAVREVIKNLKLKVPGQDQVVRRIVFIEDANKLSLEAQNALLKILEEPNPDTVFIVTAVSTYSLLPTIVSRMHPLEVIPVAKAQATDYFKELPVSKVEKQWQLSGGNAGLLHALLSDEDHPLKSAVEQAKTFIKQSPYERLLELDKLNKDKEALQLFVDALARLIAALSALSVRGGKARQSNRLLQARRQLYEFQKQLDANVNSRLLLMQLAVNLPL